jgi:hypothetical protein
VTAFDEPGRQDASIRGHAADAAIVVARRPFAVDVGHEVDILIGVVQDADWGIEVRDCQEMRRGFNSCDDKGEARRAARID